MRRLILLRHAKAEPSEPGMEDRARVLVERGRKDAAKIGAYMKSHALVPDRVAISPAARTQETWKLTAAAFRPAPGAMSAEQLYDATPHAIFALIKDMPASAHTLMVVGHNPRPATSTRASGCVRNCPPRASSLSTSPSTIGTSCTRNPGAWSASYRQSRWNPRPISARSSLIPPNDRPLPASKNMP